MRAGRRERAGFTLVEMLVVVLDHRPRVGARRSSTRRRRSARDASAKRRASPARSSMRRRSRNGGARRSAYRPKATRYRFWRRGADGRWAAFADDDVLAPRALPAGAHARRPSRMPARRSPPTRSCRSARADATSPTRSLLASPAWSVAHRRRSAEPRARRRARGFTLVEVLVALAILAVALAAGMRAVAQSADGATLLKHRTLALWVAQNRLAAAQLAAPWPALGSRERRAPSRPARVRLARRRYRARPIRRFARSRSPSRIPPQPDYALARLVGLSSGSRARAMSARPPRAASRWSRS